MNTRPRGALRIQASRSESVVDTLAVEAPLQVNINGRPWTTTMRTPGDDPFLVRGMLFSEGLLTDPAAELGWQPFDDPESGHIAAVDLTVAESALNQPFEDRRAQMSVSSCGLCGIRQWRDLFPGDFSPRLNGQIQLAADLIPAAMADLHHGMRAFGESGGCHGAAAYTARGRRLALFEDIGRHNAVDKVIGSLLSRDQLHLAVLLAVSGRISYEIVFKAFRARLPVLAAVSAPSSMAVEMADAFGLTVLGFCRDTRLTVYSHPERIKAQAQPRSRTARRRAAAPAPAGRRDQP
ncbi:MAG TPA: formate dehydrogenase accessory sulfurtransferase FdhD [Candidatus Sumerlaeota bacterium]|nr:formate dehydrogenase accessory sulfurtransferase FdhD [Candidatus Sumerlaeota bacterium]HOR27889.1 formate dehydrogenase accessory sulfurtransferase FdhD [Candidatus Sumerlaeota bacterium]HPK01030.1 formate dehydrogenase accessory sulfurtransferase FdhD [Candidatus Sumerlaeota bacterium]